MKITFTKGNGKYDRMSVDRGGATELVACPKQRIIPHDMIHFAVESALQARGFLGRVRDGEAANFRMRAEPDSDAVERLVEVFQGDAWSGGDSDPADMLDLYQVTCRARECPPLPLAPADVLAVRDRIEALDRQWQALAVGDALELEFHRSGE